MKAPTITDRASAAITGALALFLTLGLGGAQAAEQKTYVMKIGLPTLKDTVSKRCASPGPNMAAN